MRLLPLYCFLITILSTVALSFSVDMEALKESIVEVESIGNENAICVKESDLRKRTILREHLDRNGIDYKTKVNARGSVIYSIFPGSRIEATQIVDILYKKGFTNYDVGLMQINNQNFTKHPFNYLDREFNIATGMRVVEQCYEHYVKKNSHEKDRYSQEQFVARNLIRALECYKYGTKDSFPSFENAAKIISRYNKKIGNQR